MCVGGYGDGDEAVKGLSVALTQYPGLLHTEILLETFAYNSSLCAELLFILIKCI